MQCELVNLGYPQEIEKTMKCSDVDEAERLVSDMTGIDTLVVLYLSLYVFL